MNEIHAAAGKRVAVVRRAFSSLRVDYRFSIKAVGADATPSGVVEIRKSRWIFPGVTVQLPLQATNTISAGFWNTFVSVDVVPDVDAVITIEGRRMRNVRPILLLALLIVVFATAMIMAFRL